MHKRAQGLSINVIIIVAIALIVLVVLIAIFTGRLGIFAEDVSGIGTECTDFKATVDGEPEEAEWKSTCGEREKQIFTAKDANSHPGQECCIATE